jgi:hypothetical protein
MGHWTHLFYCLCPAIFRFSIPVENLPGGVQKDDPSLYPAREREKRREREKLH